MKYLVASYQQEPTIYEIDEKRNVTKHQVARIPSYLQQDDMYIYVANKGGAFLFIRMIYNLYVTLMMRLLIPIYVWMVIVL